MSRDLRVCFVGDSFVAGVGDPEHLGWTGRLCAASDRSGLPVTRYVLGVRRQTTAEVADRWAAVCRPRLSGGEWEPRLVLSTGVNDTTEVDGAPRLDPLGSVAALAGMLTGAAAGGWPVLVVGPPAVADDAQNPAHRGPRRALRADLRRPRRALRPRPRRAGRRPDLARRGGCRRRRAPRAAGYAILADLVRPEWERWTSAP
ncbi:MAG: hypothetical protein JHC71_06470 [Blastococcus sp.]|nr:hypothetical protein [Blastococcus sp.]